MRIVMEQKKQGDKGFDNDYYEYIKSILCSDNETNLDIIYNEIITHKIFMDNQLKRNVGIEVAMLDYIININKTVHIPAIFDSLNIRKIHHPSKNNHQNIKAYDTSDLSRDINIEIERAHRYGTPLSVLMFEIDDSINTNPDSEDISNFLFSNISSHVRRTDIVYTYEKNHYVLLLSETNTNEAVKAAFNLQNWFNNQKFKNNLKPDLINIGIVAYGMYGIDTDHKILTAADKTLCKAKNSGSENICLYQDKNIIDIKESKQSSLKVHKNIERLQFSGVPIHKGLAIGTVFIYNDLLSHELESYDVGEENLENELSRIIRAIENVEKDLVDIEHLINQDLSEEYAAIFQAHRLILKDSQLFNEIKKDLYEKKINGEEIVRDVFKRWEKRFLAFEDEIFRNKSQDIADISIRIIKELQGIDSHILEETPSESIIIANRLLPSDTVNINKKNVKAIVTKEGSKSSHTAILSKAMNIPLVIVENLDLTRLSNDETVIVDGTTGSVIINPLPEEENITKKQTESNLLKKPSPDNFTNPEELYFKGEKILINAAASNLSETEEADNYNAHGIGLFRTEVIYLSRNTFPDEETLVREIQNPLKFFKDRESIIRLTDIGGDKTLPYINITERYNSSLGVRGVRLFRNYPQILETQLRALLIISQNFNIKILIPMVTLLDDITFVKNMYFKIKNKMNIQNDIPIGAMIETPAAVLAIDSILECTDFVSIGTNDLIQYTMAADREKLSVSQYYEEGNKVVQEFIRVIIDKADKKKIPAYLCGELAHNTEFTKNLLDIGCRNFTVTPVMIPAVREAIKEIVHSND
jgi:phosphoenolpyruvate-protein phosphotransferase